MASPRTCRLTRNCKLEVSCNLLWIGWERKNIWAWMCGREDLFFPSVTFVNPWRIWYQKLEKKTLVWRNMRLNWRNITLTKNLVGVYITPRKLNLCNLQKISYVLFKIRWTILKQFCFSIKWRIKWCPG